MAPVPSPTPDEQAAEGCPIEGCGDNDPLALRWAVAAHEPGGPEAFFCSHACQSTAALVVVREQLTQAQARIAAVEALCDEKERVWDNHVAGSWLKTSDVREVLKEKP